MYCKITYILFLWTVIQTLMFWCNGWPQGLNSIGELANSNHSEDAIKRLLNVFALDGKIPQQKSLFLPPQYMLDLYKSYSELSTTEHKLRYRRANTVRSFTDKGLSTENRNCCYFELLESITKYEEIIDAEFHFFTNLNVVRLQQNSNLIQIQLYEEQKNSTSKLLQARMISANSSGWEVFRVKSTVKKWLLHPELNKGLSVKVLDETGYEWSNRRVQRLQNNRKSILIIFSRDTRITKGTTTHRNVKDSSSFQPISAKESRVNQRISETGSTRNARSASITENGLCTRHELRVDFDKLGWSSWIISPKWYDAFVCRGACAFPLGQNQRPSNHATVQSIVHELGLTDGVGAPCCVPTELHPVSLLYFDEHYNVVLKQYEDMVAASCGCQ